MKRYQAYFKLPRALYDEAIIGFNGVTLLWCILAWLIGFNMGAIAMVIVL